MYAQSLDLTSDVNRKLLEQNWQFKAVNFKARLEKMRKNLGTKCMYLSFISSPKLAGIKAVMINSDGGRDKVEMFVSPTINDITEAQYKKIEKRLGTGDYERSREGV